MQDPTQSSRPSLSALHDITVPEPTSWAPATTAWFVLFGLLAVGMALVVIGALRRYRGNRYRREALARLDAIDAALADPARRPEVIASLPTITKQVGLAISPREEVAKLSGKPWLAYLDATYRGDAFSNGPGRLLPTIAYASPTSLTAIPETEVAELIALLRDWIKGHNVRV